jgi:hypothetical protein
MTGLQTATDIVALAFMGIILLILFSLGIIGLVVRRKVSKVQSSVQKKIDKLERASSVGTTMFNIFKKK